MYVEHNLKVEFPDLSAAFFGGFFLLYSATMSNNVGKFLARGFWKKVNIKIIHNWKNILQLKIYSEINSEVVTMVNFNHKISWNKKHHSYWKQNSSTLKLN